MLSLLASLHPPTDGPENPDLHFSYSLNTTASPATIWRIWTDVPNWHQWDSGLQKAELNGPFRLGTKGRLTDMDGRRSKFKITAYEEGISYTFSTGLPLGKLHVRRYLSVENGLITFTHEVWFTGLGGRLIGKKIGPRFRELLPEVLHSIKELAAA